VKTGWFFYFLNYYIKTRFLKKRVPLLAGFKITHKCNLKCRHCPFWHENLPQMTFEEIKGRLKTLYNMGIRILLIEGGEPFLWRDGPYQLQDVVNEGRKYFLSVGVTTNGTISMDLDSNSLWVSLDGLKDTHNCIRGQDIFDKVIKNIESCKHPNLYVNTTINKLNWQEIPDFVKFLKGKVKGITIQFYYPYEKTDSLMLTNEQRIHVLDELIQLKKGGWPVVNSFKALNALKKNDWTPRCKEWMIVTIEPDGTITHGCYVKNRDLVQCGVCGFSTNTELTLAYELVVESINVGRTVFRYGY
jgi:MoaA/NifB/PqqE/SkfB family radical SAM enzyme